MFCSVVLQMPRGRDDMQVNVAGLRRNIKNLAHNYSDAQVTIMTIQRGIPTLCIKNLQNKTLYRLSSKYYLK